MRIERLCVFCGSSAGNLPLYTETVEALASEMAARHIGLVYGGGNRGLMGLLATSVHAAGLPVIGISPRRFHKETVPHPADEYILVDTMHERKELMYRRADAFLAIPGGIGTLEEIAEIFTWNTIGFSGKPVALLNIAGFYDPFLAQLKLMVDSGFLKAEQYARLLVSDSPKGILDALELAERTAAPWSVVDSPTSAGKAR